MEMFQQYVLPHWPFLVMALILASVGKVMKEKVWTKEKAAKGGFFWWMRALLPLHAPLTGVVIVLIGHLFGGMPVSPGVEGLPAAMLYYAGAGWASSYIYSLGKHFLKSRGIKINSA